MKGINKRNILVTALGFVMGRAVFFSMNPIGIGYYLCAAGEDTGRIMLAAALILGMAGKMDAISVIKYLLVLFTMSVIRHLFQREKKAVSEHMRALTGAGVTTALSLTKAFMYRDFFNQAALAFLEGLLVYLSFFLLKKGVSYILYHRKNSGMSNEELLSVGLILGILVYSIPNVDLLAFSIPQTAAFLVALCIGYKYGPGTGAVAGAVCGIVLSYSYRSVTFIGILCILGICSGMFQEIGKLGAGIAFLATGVSLGFLYEQSLVKIQGVESLALSALVFFLIPSRLLKPVHWESREEESYVRQNIRQLTKSRFHEFSDSLQKLSKSFLDFTEKKNILGCDDMNGIFEEISGKFCKDCVYCSHCWEDNYEMTYAFAQDIFETAKKNGHIKMQDIPSSFKSQCVYADAFVRETNKSLEIATLNLKWYNKLMESRQAVAGQLNEMAGIVKDFAYDITEMREVKNSLEEQMISNLRLKHIEAKNLVMMENKAGHLEIHMMARAKRGHCVNTREAAASLGRTAGKRMKPAEQMKSVIPAEYTSLIFREDTKYKVLTGVARVTKEGEDISGDNFSFLELESGELVMTLCDGMGSGKTANAESKSIIDLLEDFMEAGFNEAAAIHLINSLYVLKADGQIYSTIDMGIINLFSGRCNIVKMGAAATFIRHGEKVDTILSSSLPAGIFEDSSYEGSTKLLKDNDFIIMMTDGVIDCFPGDEKEESIGRALLEIKSNNPREIANALLQRALEQSDHTADDDMTVIVAGIWEKP